MNVKQIPILDTDVYSKEALATGEDATERVIKRYGSRVFTEEKGLKKINRFALGEIIFYNKDERYWLENLLHPIIKKRLEEDIDKFSNFPTIAMIIPLLYEANFTSFCNETWLIYCRASQQYERLRIRNGFNLSQSKARIESQLSLEDKKHLVDKIIDNSIDFELCFKQIDEIL